MVNHAPRARQPSLKRPRRGFAADARVSGERGVRLRHVHGVRTAVELAAAVSCSPGARAFEGWAADLDNVRGVRRSCPRWVNPADTHSNPARSDRV